MSHGAEERRRAERHELGREAEIFERVGGQWGKAFARDVSRVGMFLQTMSEGYRAGQMLTVRFHLPTTDIHVEVRGRVVRVVPVEQGAESDPAGVAIEFLDVAGWAMDEVVHFIESRGAEMRGGTIVTDD